MSETTGMKKKIGPLPIWAWVVIVGGTIGIFLYYRSATSSSTSTASTSDTVDPSNPLGLTYGEESSDEAAGIDPMTGATYASEQATATGSDDGTDGSSGSGTDSGVDPDTGDPYGQEILAALSGISDTTIPGQTFLGELADVNAVKTALGLPISGASNLTTAAAQRLSNVPLTVKGAIAAPFGANKPAAKKGYTIRGLGNGNWEYVPIPKTTSSGSGSAGSTGNGSGQPAKTIHVTIKPAPPKTKQGKATTVSGKKH
jgi:hypothetical protein